MGDKLKASLLLVVMFALGALAGMSYQSCRTHRRWAHRHFVERRLDRLKKDLKLTDAQEKAVRDILQRAHQKASQVDEEVAWDLADIHRSSIKELRAVLTPDQQKEFDKFHRGMHARRHRVMDDAPSPGGEPGSPAPPGPRRPPPPESES